MSNMTKSNVAVSATYEINLKTGTITGTPNHFITLVKPPIDANGDSWLETLVKIDFKDFTTVKFIVDCGGTPSGWMVNIGDSVSNDGYGGDAGTQSNDAEMQIVKGGMAVFGNDYNKPAGAQIVQGNVPNLVGKDSRLELEISNKNLAWNNNKGLQNSLNSPYLYSLARQADATGQVNSSIYASFNRVIRDRADRLGSGVSKVTILIDPIEYSITPNKVAITEGNSGTTPVTFTIARSGAISRASSVDYTIGGTATNSSNYHNIEGISGATGATNTAGTIDFAPGELSKTITVSVLGDSFFEPDETIAVALSNPVAPFSYAISTAVATTTIENDDAFTIAVNSNVFYAIAVIGLAFMIFSIAKLRSGIS
ncbi:MAG: hypothetical protein MUE44_17670 [Oscillatoriaceae cyanobacterium Prado104]|jgi:hypothetical protein|nr:hypothetical protein [Oscillatoriaceae cyanobacterium Prado104]